MRPIWTIQEVRREIMKLHDLPNNNRISLAVEVDPSTVLDWERGGVPKKARTIARLAELINEDEGYLAHCFAIQRETDANLADKMRTWLVTHATAAMIILAVFCGVFSSSEAQAGASPAPSNLYIMRALRTNLARASRIVTGWFQSAQALTGTLFDHRLISTAHQRHNRLYR